MRNIARRSTLAAVLAVVTTFAACSGDDDDSPGVDAGPDSSVDARGGSGGGDAAREATGGNAGTAAGGGGTGGAGGAGPVEAGVDTGADTSQPVEAGADQRAPDANPDVRTEAAVGPDAADAGARDAEAGAIVTVDAEAGAARDAEAGVARDAEAGAVEAAVEAGRDAEAGALEAAADVHVDAPVGLDATADRGDAAPVSTVVVNEINAVGLDFVELFNTGAAAVDVSGWTLSDDQPNAGGRPFVIPNGSVIQPGGYLTLYGSADGGFSFGLGSPDSVILRDDNGNLILDFPWTTPAPATDSRCPNGTGAFSNGRAPTPGATNDCSQ